jgi:Pla-1/cef family extracellular lipase
MLAITGILSVYGFATVAINHPLHGDPDVFGGLLPGGSRGFDITGPEGVPDGVDDINASTVSATHYMNLASLLTTRDNLRQSTSDLVGLRLGLNFLGGVHVEGNPIKVDSNNVHFLGHSLGAITGINFIAVTNTALVPTVDPLFAVKTNSLAMPGVMIANFLMESGAFGDVIKSGIAIAGHAGFQGYVAQAHEGTMSPTEAELIGYFNSYLEGTATETNKAELSAMFAQFTFAAQTVTDSADPANYAAMMAATQTPTHLIEVVGNGVDTVEGGSCTDIALTDNCSDQVIPNRISTSPLGGTEGAIALLGLPSVSTTTEGSGAVRFVYGHHGSILTPSAIPGVSPDAQKSGVATQEMQGQVVGFFATMGQLIIVTDEDSVR